MIIIKDLPDVIQRDLIDTLRVIREPGDPEPKIGYGGVVVGERHALNFLQIYMAAYMRDDEPTDYHEGMAR
jgi:hypothetical protein